MDQVLVLLAVPGTDRVGLREPQDRVLFGLAQLLPAGLRRALVGQDSLQRREAVGVIGDGAGQGREDVRFGIGVQQRQHLGRLVLGISLLGQQPFQEAAAHFTQLGEPLAQTRHLRFVVLGRRMRGSHPPLASLALEQNMLGDGREVAAVDHQRATLLRCSSERNVRPLSRLCSM